MNGVVVNRVQSYDFFIKCILSFLLQHGKLANMMCRMTLIQGVRVVAQTAGYYCVGLPRVSGHIASQGGANHQIMYCFFAGGAASCCEVEMLNLRNFLVGLKISATFALSNMNSSRKII